MHILVIPSEQYVLPERPLAGIFQKTQVDALHRAGQVVSVIAPKGRSLRTLPSGFQRLSRGIAHSCEEGIRVARNLNWSLVPDRVPYLAVNAYVRTGRRLYEDYVARFGEPDILHAHGALYAGSLAAYLQTRYHVPSVLTEHSSAFLIGELQPWQRRIARAAWHQADSCIVVSAALGRGVDRALMLAPGLWRVVPNCLDRIFEDERPPQLRQPSGKPLALLTIGALVPIKNHLSLLEAFASLDPQDFASLRIGGDGPLREALEHHATSLGITDRVRLLGALSPTQVRSEMLQCDMFVLPSHAETFGVVLIEALACGRPVVATPCGGPTDIVNPTDGVLARSPSSPDLATALSEARRRFGEFEPDAIRARCLARYGRIAVAHELETVYEEIRARRCT
ncbi:MAG: glycosyltransferase [Candidatus Bipolaricaulota bacterium]